MTATQSARPTEPNFFVVGAAKSATTSLYFYLRPHPEVFVPEDEDFKEPSYYCDGYGMKDPEAYRRLFAGAAGKKAIGELSTAYLTAPECAARLREAHPAAKIVIVLRNPADRAFSLYNWMIREGYEWLWPFERALELEPARAASESFRRSNPQYFHNYMYYGSGLYAEQVERYLQQFPRERILFLRFEDFARDAGATARRVYEFLGVDPSFTPAPEVHNPAQVPWSPRLQFAARRMTTYLPLPGFGILQRAIFGLNLRLGRGLPARIDPGLRAELLKRYRENIARAAELTGLDLSGWAAK